MIGMDWIKLSPAEPIVTGCATCIRTQSTLPMTRLIAVGFGDAFVSKDGETVWEETNDAHEVYARRGRVRSRGLPIRNLWSVASAEEAARRDPDHDWRIVLDGPLHSATYQRQGRNLWVLVDQNRGFA